MAKIPQKGKVEAPPYQITLRANAEVNALHHWIEYWLCFFAQA
jgi:hypothetical protein